jgi:hypothetical protein
MNQGELNGLARFEWEFFPVQVEPETHGLASDFGFLGKPQRQLCHD